MTGTILGVVALLAAGLVVVILGNRMLWHGGAQGSGTADALGNFIDVFDPARARANRDLESKAHQGEIVPRPDDDDRPVQVDLSTGRARVRRPR